MLDRGKIHELLSDPEFKDLAKRKDSISTILTVATLVVYYGFILLIAFNREFFGKKFTENIPIGIPIGIGVILISWAFTGLYVRWANSRYDAMVENMKRRAEHARN
jgi:uncharacterized membrane protein (DUF485 family)